MHDNYGIIIGKLDEFIRKYYRNQLLRGLILFAAVLFVSVLVVSVTEYFGHFSPVVRTILFYLFLIVNISIAACYIVLPLLKLNRIGRIITHEQAAVILGRHFPEVSDKLLNTLQLRKSFESGNDNSELLKAGIDQKIAHLSPVPFLKAIDLKKNRKFLRYALPPFMIILLLLFISPGMITKPSERLIFHTRQFEEEAPFTISVQNDQLQAYQQEDFTLRIKVTGETLPDEVMLEREGSVFRMDHDSKILFSYTFKKLQKSETFRMIAGKFTTKDYTLEVFPRPVIINFTTELTYPAYTGRKAESFDNTGDMVIPEGTKVKWLFYTRDADALEIRFDSTVRKIEKTENGNSIEFASVFGHSARYSVKALNQYVKKPDSLLYSMTVIPDAFPVITVDEEKDSTLSSRLFFRGVIKDDYGFSALTIRYSLLYQGDSTQREDHSEQIPFTRGMNQQNFFYSLDIRRFTQNPGDVLEYYFEVCDNDGIHGPKCTRTGMFSFRTPTLAEIEQITDKQQENISSNLEKSIKEVKQLQKQIDDLNKKLVDKKELSWQEKKQMKEILDRHEQIKKEIEQIQKENQKKDDLQQQYNQFDETIVEKQQQLQQLFNEVMDEKTRKMFEEMQKMLDKINKDQVSDMLEKMKMSNKDIEKQLDRNLEIFKQLEFEKKLAETTERLKDLSDKLDSLSEKTKDKAESSQQLQNEQEKMKNEFDQVKDDLKKLMEANKELEEPNKMPELTQDKENTDKEIQESQESLQKGNRKKASDSQKKASQSMKSMAQKLENSQAEQESEQMAEDMGRLREILENLIRISFGQEDLMNRTANINRNDPKYLNILQQQNDLKDDITMVEDSLYALAKRQPMIKPYVMREASAINQNIGYAVKLLNDRNIQGAASKQQFVMTSVNNLALLLNESMKQMENSMQMQSQSSGKSNCKNPGGKKSQKMSMKNMRQMQESLNRQMQEMKKAMEQGKQQQGNQQQGGQKGMSEKLARMAAEQEAIRNEMKKYADQLNEEGNLRDGSGANQLAGEMEQTEKDLVNKKILQETLNRQQQILTRMLESEKAEQKRDQEEQRKSTEAKNQNFSNPETDFQYNRLKNKTNDLLKTNQPDYNYFYKTKINSYFLKIGD